MGDETTRMTAKPTIDHEPLPGIIDLEVEPRERSADIHPAIENEDDLERVTTGRKTMGLSEEARQQIAPKLKPKKAA